MAVLKIGRVRMGWKGAWNNTTAYVAQDAVFHNGETYVARIDVPAGTTPYNETFWQLVAKKGEDGKDGADGAQGPVGPKGAQGDTGPQGVEGDTGPTGPVGPQGATGAKGETGATGVKGATGATGPTPEFSWDGYSLRFKDPSGTWGSYTNLRGPIGPQGPRGAVGETGAKGDQGDTGEIGPRGPQGLTGAAGATGPVGPQGDKGDLGSTGPVGPQGLKGDTGATGPVGPQGLKGNTGAQGPVGPQGEVGDQGDTGPQGPKGDTGAEGPEGPQGPTGAKGNTGATGPIGPQGVKGNTGATGPQGVKGATGATGAAPDHSWSGYSLRFKNPNGTWAGYTNLRGPTGATGPQGNVGPQGETGPKGVQGATGLQGAKGDKGATGLQGPTGPTGPQGPQGNTGAAPEHTWSGVSLRFKNPNGTWGSYHNLRGPQGAVGPQGTKGDKGTTGAQGPVGPQGPRGLQGIEGPEGAIGATGSAGAKGAKGDTGARGPTGPTGARGPRGYAGSNGTNGTNGADGQNAVGPIGSLIWHAGTTAPDGYLVADGSVVSTAYPDLRNVLISSGYPFGKSGSSPRLPDLRGEFIRGHDGGRGVDAGRAFGSSQLDEFKAHSHDVYPSGSAGGFSDAFDVDNPMSGDSKNIPKPSSTVGGSETRPRNVALLPCIKAYGAINIAGQANLDQLLNAVATQAQAVAGLDNSKLMTPLRTKQAIEQSMGAGIKAWVNFNGTGTPAIRDSYNVTSITDNGTGDYTVNYASSVAGNPAVIATRSGPTDANTHSLFTLEQTATKVRIRITWQRSYQGNVEDADYLNVAVIGG